MTPTTQVNIRYTDKVEFLEKLNTVRDSLGLDVRPISNEPIIISKEEIISLFNKEGFNISLERSKTLPDQISVAADDISLASCVNIIFNF